LKRLRKVAPERARKPDVLRAAVMIQAAPNDADGVKRTLAGFRSIGGAHEMTMLQRRADDRGQFYKTAMSDGAMLLAQFPLAGGQDGTVYITTQISDTCYPGKWNPNNLTWDQVIRTADYVGVAPDGRPWIFDAESPAFIPRAR